MKFRAFYNSKSAALVQAIIKNEDLDVSWQPEVDALGDTVIVATGPREDVLILTGLFNLAAPRD